jgi:hypothetical protein
MQCVRCGEELPNDTPVCRRCGPVSFGASPWASSPLGTFLSESSPPPTPAAFVEVPAPVPLPPTGLPAAAEPPTAAPPAAPPKPAASTKPAAPPRQTKQQKRERARKKLAERGLLQPEPTFKDRGPTFSNAPEKPALPPFLQRLDKSRSVAPDDSPAPVQFTVPPAIRLLALIDLVMGLAYLVVAAALSRGVGAALPMSESVFGSFLPAAFGLGFLVAASGLILLQPFGRKAQFALCAASLPCGGLFFPVAVLIVFYVMRPGVALLLSGRPPAKMTPNERGLVREDTPGVTLIRVAAVIQAVVLTFRFWPLLAAL